jgi:hypothetical protein
LTILVYVFPDNVCAAELVSLITIEVSVAADSVNTALVDSASVCSSVVVPAIVSAPLLAATTTALDVVVADSAIEAVLYLVSVTS